MFKKCDCGEYALVDDLLTSEVSDLTICPKCSVTCPNCGRIVHESEILWTQKCSYCDEDF